ncbi:MAG TPA: DUF5671 domain-containing protein [Candidatus Nanopelagicaceae bacterium]|nr:DUF5671 domain-containing protein [Candidatus Nanopelagicaceae bacterium]
MFLNAVGLLPTLLMIALIVFVIRRMARGRDHQASLGHPVRRFFQYVLLFGLLVVSASGISGLLSRLLERGTIVVVSQTELARNVSFTIVGIPLLVVVAIWTRRKFREDRTEVGSFGWAFYITAASLTSLIVSMFALHGLLAWVAGTNDFNGQTLAILIIWGAIFGVHWWLDARLTPAEHSNAHHLLGSIIGLGVSAVGLAGLITGVLEFVIKFSGQELLAGGGNPILNGGITLAVGAPAWYLYWIRTSAGATRDQLWLAYVLLAGVGGGLVVAVVSASTVLYQVLVWFVGDPGAAVASLHFQNTNTALGVMCIGTLMWWYHHAVLERSGAEGRTEVRRIYEYLMAGIGLAAAAVGLIVLLAALFEAAAGSATLAGPTSGNTLLAAVTLMLVGGPIWWYFWRRIQIAIQTGGAQELSSPTRRVFLFLLFGVGGIASVISLLLGVYFFVEDVLGNTLSIQTLRRMRYPIGMLITSGAVAGYHWMVYRAERNQVAESTGGPRFVLLVGPHNPDLVHAVAEKTQGRVQAWTRTGEDVGSWSTENVLALLETVKDDEVIILADVENPRAIPIDRGFQTQP